MTGLPFRTLAFAAVALAGCASGNGAAFNAASSAQAEQQASSPQDSLAAGGVNGVNGVKGGGLTGPSHGGSGGKVIYVSGNVLLPARGLGSGRTVSAGASLSGASASAKVTAGGVKVALGSDPLGGQVAKVSAGGVSASIGDPLAGLGKGKSVLGGKGKGSGALGGAGKAAGSLIGSGSKGADNGVNLLIGNLAGGKHRKPGL
jgi:hypothetical protein